MSLDELAASVGVSRRQIERLFKRHLDRVPTRYYLELRLRRARELLLQTSMSIMDITIACGFQSPPHFSKCYRSLFGYPPSAERQAGRAVARLDGLRSEVSEFVGCRRRNLRRPAQRRAQATHVFVSGWRGVVAQIPDEMVDDVRRDRVEDPHAGAKQAFDVGQRRSRSRQVDELTVLVKRRDGDDRRARAARESAPCPALRSARARVAANGRFPIAGRPSSLRACAGRP